MPYYTIDEAGNYVEKRLSSDNSSFTAGHNFGETGWLIMLLFGLAICAIYMYANRKSPNAEGHDRPTGVGGWLRIIFGLIFSILGVFLLSSAVAHAPPYKYFQFYLGYYLPSGGVAVFGILLLAWEMRSRYGLGDPISGQPVQPGTEMATKVAAIETTTHHPEETMAAPGNTELPINVEDQIYTQIADELDSGNLDKATWTKAYATSDGDDKKARSAYIKQRAERLFAAERLRLEQGQTAHELCR